MLDEFWSSQYFDFSSFLQRKQSLLLECLTLKIKTQQSFEASVFIYKYRRCNIQKILIFINSTVRTSNLSINLQTLLKICHLDHYIVVSKQSIWYSTRIHVIRVFYPRILYFSFSFRSCSPAFPTLMCISLSQWISLHPYTLECIVLNVL